MILVDFDIGALITTFNMVCNLFDLFIALQNLYFFSFYFYY